MTVQQITNPLARLQGVTNFTSGKTPEGELINYGSRIETFRANAAIARGRLLAIVPPTATNPLSVKERVTGDLTPLSIGIAVTSAVAGQEVQVCTYGHCEAFVGAATAAAGNYGIHDTVAGEIDVASSAPDATTISGNILGIFLGAKDASNLAPFWFDRR